MATDDNLISGAAILGFYAAIKICVRDGYDWRQVAELVEPVARKDVEEQGDEDRDPND